MTILDLFQPIYSRLPELRTPEVQLPVNRRILWSAGILVLFFIMGNIPVLGVGEASAQQLEQLQVILASDIGTLITVGIGPIVLASIMLQLLVGAKIIDVDLSNPADKAKFTGMQKLLAIVLSFIEAVVYVFSGFVGAQAGMETIVIAQIAVGAIALLYMDEVVSKYGIGSGIGLFIAGGVSKVIIVRMFNPFNALGQIDFTNAQGLIFLLVNNFTAGPLIATIQYLMPFIFTLVVFFVVVYAEGIHANIPVTMGRRGTGGRFPVKFLYVSNIPVILAVALFANVQIWATFAKDVPIMGTILGGISAIVVAPYNLFQDIALQLATGTFDIGIVIGEFFRSIFEFQFFGLGGAILHGILYIAILVVMCIIFGKFWVDMAGQGPKNVSAQLQKSGMQIPGFRRDPRIMTQVLERYIPPVAVLGSAFVGLLAGFADLTGSLGGGTGILLTVGIVYRLYEELAKQQLMGMHPMLGRLLG